jgi:hypothetical protein
MERGGAGTDFRDDRLRGIDAKAGHFGQALHHIVVVSEQLRHLLIELGEHQDGGVVRSQVHRRTETRTSRRTDEPGAEVVQTGEPLSTFRRNPPMPSAWKF